MSGRSCRDDGIPCPCAEHSLKSLGSLMQRLPLEAEAVKQQSRVTEPTGRRPLSGPKCVANTILSAARGPQPCCTLSQTTSPSYALGMVRTRTPPPHAQTGPGRRQGTQPGSQPRTTTERLQANHSTRPGPRSPPGKMATAWPSWPVTKTSSGQLLRPPETRPAMPTAATQSRQTGTEPSGAR